MARKAYWGPEALSELVLKGFQANAQRVAKLALAGRIQKPTLVTKHLTGVQGLAQAFRGLAQLMSFPANLSSTGLASVQNR